MLNLIVSTPQFFGGVNFEDKKEIIEAAIAEGHQICSIAYFHGVLEDAIGYDIGACLNAEELIKDDKFVDGIYDAKVQNYDNPCKAFIWNTPDMTRGLIVDASNDADMAYAQKHYNSKSDFL